MEPPAKSTACRRETVPIIEVRSSRFSVEVTDLYKQRQGDEERGDEAVFYR